MVDKHYAAREIQSLLEGILNNVGFFDAPVKERVNALVAEIRQTLAAGPSPLVSITVKEEHDPDEIARTTWAIADLEGAIASKYGVEPKDVAIHRDTLAAIGADIRRQLEDDCTERGWASIDTQLDILEEQGAYPVLGQLRANRDREAGAGAPNAETE